MALRKQGISRRSLPWYNWWTPYASSLALFFCLLLLLTNGFAVFVHNNWSTAGFITAYIDIPLVLLAYGIWKLVKRTKWVKLEDIPLGEVLDALEDEREREREEGGWDEEGRGKGWIRWISWLWD